MKRIVVLLLLFPALLNAQRYINSPKNVVRKAMEQYVEKNLDWKPTLEETDSTITVNITATETSQPATFIYRFDKKSKCMYQKTITSCDSCLRRYLDNALNQKEFHWRKINGNQYVSDFKSRMLLEVSGRENDYSFVILRTDWTRQLYDILSGN